MKSPREYDGVETVDLGDAVAEAVKVAILSGSLEYTQNSEINVQIVVDMPKVPINAKVGRGDLMHIFTNLISNAVSAARLTPKDQLERDGEYLGRANVRIWSLGSADFGNGPQAGVGVSNLGPKLSVEDFEWLTKGAFDHAANPDPCQRRFRKGSMGLRLVRRLIEARGGRIGVSPSSSGDMVGKTTVEVWLPV